MGRDSQAFFPRVAGRLQPEFSPVTVQLPLGVGPSWRRSAAPGWYTTAHPMDRSRSRLFLLEAECSLFSFLPSSCSFFPEVDGQIMPPAAS